MAKVTGKAKAVARPATRLRARKVNRVVSPMPEAIIMEPPVAGPSVSAPRPLFAAAVLSSDEGGVDRGMEDPQVPGEPLWSRGLQPQ